MATFWHRVSRHRLTFACQSDPANSEKKGGGREMPDMADIAATGMCRGFLEFPAVPEKVPDVRQHIRHVLASLAVRDGELVHTAQLIVTELVGNAVRAAGGDGDRRVRVSARRSGDLLVLLVWDDCDGVPKQCAPGDLDEGGRGLWLVDMLTLRWGHHHLGDGGKTVWALIRAGGPGASAGE
jgi:anti-sigma regulatory factor (Ser/Thr protein kinase)